MCPLENYGSDNVQILWKYIWKYISYVRSIDDRSQYAGILIL